MIKPEYQLKCCKKERINDANVAKNYVTGKKREPNQRNPIV